MMHACGWLSHTTHYVYHNNIGDGYQRGKYFVYGTIIRSLYWDGDRCHTLCVFGRDGKVTDGVLVWSKFSWFLI